MDKNMGLRKMLVGMSAVFLVAVEARKADFIAE